MALDMNIKTPFQTLFAVPMTCGDCVKVVSNAINKLDGTSKVDVDLQDQLVTVEGTAAPSAVVSAIESTGRDAILRGSGKSNSAAVCIFEIFYEPNDSNCEASVAATEDGKKRDVRGLARMVEVDSDITLVDLTLRGVDPGSYQITIREYGDLSKGARSTGPVWSTHLEKANPELRTNPRGSLGTLQVGSDGNGSIFLDRSFQIWEIIGHAMVITPENKAAAEQQLKNDENTLVGVIARSAGMWDNDKTVCSCTGKTLWEERKDEVARGMI